MSNLIGVRYIQATDPGIPPSGGYEWFKTTTGQLFIRDKDNTFWQIVGDSQMINMGLVPVSGAQMTGALPGVTGWAPETAPDFQNSAKRDGIELATKGDISSLRREFIQRFNTMSQEMLSNISTSSSAKSNIAFKSGLYTTGGNDYDFTIPLPQYDGGTGATAVRTEVIAHACWPVRFDLPLVSGHNDSVRVTLVNDTTMTWHAKCYDTTNSSTYPVDIGYMVIAVK